jgi:transposase
VLLPDRTAATVATWLAAHPEIEVISRDRGGAYAEAARQGAPQAKQVADRWHLLCNLGDAVERLLSREHSNLRRAAPALGPEAAGGTAGGTAPTGGPSPDEAPSASPPAATPEPRAPTALERERAASRERRLARYEEVVALHQQGLGIAAIAKRLTMARKTVRRFLRARAFPERAPRAGPPGVLAPFFDDLQARWDAGCHNARQLDRELKALGYAGSASYLSEVLATWRTEPASTGRRRVAPWPASLQRRRPLRPRPPDRSPRQVRFLLFGQTEQLDAADRAYRNALFTASPSIQAVHQLVEEFRRLVTAHDVGTLAPWLTTAQQTGVPELQGFVVGIRQDRAAVEAGITEPWSQGQVEGQVNRLKVIKRSMFGRAKLDLLRLRVLHPI